MDVIETMPVHSQVMKCFQFVQYLEQELGPEAVTMMGSIKRTLDPHNLMNPGKVVPEKFCY
jgi:D-lactate dehydrogenase (cytochrome)